mmetsp:Transcript_4461/g.14876  ORF Transcript_4461/g.14876 Transcript_4461/m.14876 type:complete len:436 (-) Transcript_4461:524-1831(-)
MSSRGRCMESESSTSASALRFTSSSSFPSTTRCINRFGLIAIAARNAASAFRVVPGESEDPYTARTVNRTILPSVAIWCSYRPSTCMARSFRGSSLRHASHSVLIARDNSTFSRLSLHMQSRPSAAPRLTRASACAGFIAIARAEIAAASFESVRANAVLWNTSGWNTRSLRDLERHTSTSGSFGVSSAASRNCSTAPSLSQTPFKRHPSFTWYSTSRAHSLRESSVPPNPSKPRNPKLRTPPTNPALHRFAFFNPSFMAAGEIEPALSALFDSESHALTSTRSFLRRNRDPTLQSFFVSFSSHALSFREEPNGSIHRSPVETNAAAFPRTHRNLPNDPDVSLVAATDESPCATFRNSVATNWSICRGVMNCLIRWDSRCAPVFKPRRAFRSRRRAPCHGPGGISFLCFCASFVKMHLPVSKLCLAFNESRSNKL